MFNKYGFPGGSDGKESACSAGDFGFDTWVEKFPWKRKWQPALVFLPGKSHGWRNLAGFMGLQRGRRNWVTSFSLVIQIVKNLFTIQETQVRSLGGRRSPEEGHGNPLQYFFLENAMGRGAWWATVQGVSKSLNTYQGHKSSPQEDLHLDRKCSVNIHSFHHTPDSVGPASRTVYH